MKRRRYGLYIVALILMELLIAGNTVKSTVGNRNKKQYLTWWILPLVLIGGWFYPALGYLLPICMVVAIGIAIFKGRYWCDWLCPRGATWDLFLSKISLKKEVPPFFKSTPFRMLWIVILMGVLAWKLPSALASLDRINQVGMVFIMLLTVTTAIGIVFGIPIHHRIWCSGFCPMGTMSSWVGKGRYALEINSNCRECKICHNACPMQIRKWDYKKDGQAVVENWDCLKCGLCVDVCPSRALKFKEAS